MKPDYENTASTAGRLFSYAMGTLVVIVCAAGTAAICAYTYKDILRVLG